jgi:hypothetical protein
MSYLRYLHIVVSNTYTKCIVFLFCLSCVHYVASGLSIFDYPFDILLYLRKYPSILRTN